jgi:hypothetical protein
MSDEPTKTDEPVKTDPVSTEPVKTDPVKTDPAEPAKKDEPAKTDPVKKDEPKKDEPKKSHSLFDDPEPAKKDSDKKDDPAAPTEEQSKAFTDEVKKIDLGEGVVFDDDAMAAMSPALYKLTGGDPAKAEEAVKAYTEFTKMKAAKAEEARNAHCDALIEADKKEFGADLPKVVELAKVGGKSFFGEKKWNILKGIPEFVNDPDILKALADHGRRVQNDKGGVKPKDGKSESDGGDLFHRMYRGVKV